MFFTRPSTPRTVGDVLRRPFSGSRCAASPPLPPLLRGPAEERSVFLTETDVECVPQRVVPSRLQSAPASRPTLAPSHRLSADKAPSRGGSAKKPAAAGTSRVVRTAVPPPVRVGQHTRRPVDEALFCALRMEGEDTVAAQLRQLGPERLVNNFRSLCSRLSMHHVTAAQFTFLCAAVLNASVAQRDCEVVFAFLRTEQGVGSLDVADLLLRLRTLFMSPEVLCALQLKRMLETNALSECTVSLDELHKAVGSLQRLMEAGPARQQLTQQWHHLLAELERIHVQYAVLVPTFRVSARRIAPALCAALQALNWDGTWGLRDGESAEESAREEESGAGAAAAASSSRPTTGAYRPEAARAVPHHLPPAESPAALLADVTTLYRQRWAEKDASAQMLASASLSSGLVSATRRADRRSTWRESSSAVDATNPHFLADVYATGRVVCTRD